MAKLVNFSEAASLALHAMVIIAKSDNHVNVNSIANEMGASKNHLAKVLQQLVKHNYLKSVRGPNGGFILSKPADQISVLEIYESIEGKIETPECPLDRQICPFNKCLMSGLVTDVLLQFKKYFGEQSLEDFVTRT
ncbi:MAG: Rrf2 family transcriptional regulator [Bacteroidales bacterium]|nr:Rrf2 family transcriptional regulator [Bacteroidales bacterium]